MDRVKETIKRTPETNKRYLAFLASGKKPKWEVLTEYNNWVIMKNEYPYDAITEKHHLLFPKRDFKYQSDMTFAEYTSLQNLKNEFNKHNLYDSILENFDIAKSIPEKFHLHLIKWKEND